ncbi:MAG TPA: methyltransferase [Candidatus Wallbacteria bacterium]|nr:methyltransferase [Candidatus Wallbacteria bacterium]
MNLNKLHELEFNLRLQITTFIAAAALVTPMFTNIRIYEYLGLTEVEGIKFLYAAIGAVCFAAFAVRAWGAAYLSSYVVMAREANQDKLIVAGPFMFVRNPLYFGDILGAAAIACALPAEGFIIMVPPLAIHSYLLARYEEKQMLLKYGENYAEFLAGVNRLMPSLKPYKHSGYEDFIKKYRPDWPDAVMSNIYFAGIGAAFIAAAFTGDSRASMERCVYIYSFAALTAWSVFYMIYYHPKHFNGGRSNTDPADKYKKEE